MTIKGTTVLVTGGAGFIGSHIVDQLLSEGVKKVTIVDNYLRGSRSNIAHLVSNKKVEVIDGDIRNIPLVRKITNVDYIFHQAAVRLVTCQNDPRLCHEIMVDGTFNILEAAVIHKVKKVVMASSVSVYGEPSYVPMDEGHPYNNTTVYGAAKIANEHMAKAFHHLYGLPIILFRYFNVYGPRMDTKGAYTEVLITWLTMINSDKAPAVHGNGSQSLDFVYVGDVARANILAAKSDVPFGIYNIGTGKTTSLKNLLEMILRIKHSRLSPVFDAHTKRPYVQKRQASTKRAKKDLGFIAGTPLARGLGNLINWMDKNQ